MLIAVVLTSRALLKRVMCEWFWIQSTWGKVCDKTTSLNGYTHHLLLFPRFHSRFIFFEFVTPVRVDLLIVGAFVWWSASGMEKRQTFCFYFRRDSCVAALSKRPIGITPERAMDPFSIEWNVDWQRSIGNKQKWAKISANNSTT